MCARTGSGGRRAWSAAAAAVDGSGGPGTNAGRGHLGNFENNIRAASRRYASDLILTGRLVRVDKSLWRGEWRLYHADSQNNWNNEAASRNALTVDALQRTADSLANRFAPIERSLSTVRLRVSGIDSLEDYAAVLGLLGGQSSLERVVISSVEPKCSGL